MAPGATGILNMDLRKVRKDQKCYALSFDAAMTRSHSVRQKQITLDIFNQPGYCRSLSFVMSQKGLRCYTQKTFPILMQFWEDFTSKKTTSPRRVILIMSSRMSLKNYLGRNKKSVAPNKLFVLTNLSDSVLPLERMNDLSGIFVDFSGTNDSL